MKIVVEKSENSFGAYVPDSQGCIAVGETREEVLSLIQEAIEFHLKDLAMQDAKIPKPFSRSEYVEVLVA